MERRVIIVCCFVGFLGILSAATAFAAEAKRIKVRQLMGNPGCGYPRGPAFGLALTATVTLVIAQITISVCIGCRQDSHHHQQQQQYSLAFSWVAFVVALLLLLGGAALNDEQTRENMYLGNHVCVVVDPGWFALAAVLSLVSVALGIFHYLALTSGNDRNQIWGASVFPT